MRIDVKIVIDVIKSVKIQLPVYFCLIALFISYGDVVEVYLIVSYIQVGGEIIAGLQIVNFKRGFMR